MEIADEHVRRTFLPDIPNPKLTGDFGEVSTAEASAPSSRSRRFFAKALHPGMLVGFAM